MNRATEILGCGCESCLATLPLCDHCDGLTEDYQPNGDKGMTYDKDCECEG